MSNLQNEILNAIDDIQKKLSQSQNIDEKDLEVLFLSALIEEEA